MASSQQLRVYVLLYLTYAVFYFMRSNYGLWLQALINIEGVPKSTAGSLGSNFELWCGLGKLFGGYLVDQLSPRRLICLCLVVCGTANLFMFSSDISLLDTTLWSLNGLLQSLGWPALVRILFVVFPKPEERGTWYSVLSTSQSFGAGVTPVILSSIMSSYGWRASLRVPGMVGLALAVVVWIGLKGHEPASTPSKAPVPANAKQENKSEEEESIVATILFNRTLWAIGLAYFAVSIVRSGVVGWAAVFLQDRKAGDGASVAVTCLFLYEVGSLTGGVLAGMISDKIFKGDRFPVMILSCLSLSAALFLMSQASTLPSIALYPTFFCVGSFAFAPHMLFGLAARETVPMNAISSAGGFVKGVAQLGGVVAGSPLGALAEASGWGAVHTVFISTGVSAAAILFLDGRLGRSKAKVA